MRVLKVVASERHLGELDHFSGLSGVSGPAFALQGISENKKQAQEEVR